MVNPKQQRYGNSVRADLQWEVQHYKDLIIKPYKENQPHKGKVMRSLTKENSNTRDKIRREI